MAASTFVFVTVPIHTRKKAVPYTESRLELISCNSNFKWHTLMYLKPVRINRIKEDIDTSNSRTFKNRCKFLQSAQLPMFRRVIRNPMKSRGPVRDRKIVEGTVSDHAP